MPTLYCWLNWRTKFAGRSESCTARTASKRWSYATICFTDHANIKLYEPAALNDSGVADSCLFWLYASVPVKLLRNLLAWESTIDLYDTGNYCYCYLLLGSSLESLGFILVILKKRNWYILLLLCTIISFQIKKLKIHSKMN